MLDIRDYAMGEGSAAERQAFAAELANSAALREELQRYELTLTALQSVPEEEIPRRIAFVSDPVFAPKWWQKFSRYRSGDSLRRSFWVGQFWGMVG